MFQSYGLEKSRQTRIKGLVDKQKWSGRIGTWRWWEEKEAQLIEMQEISRLQLPPYHAPQCLTVHSHHSPAFSSPSRSSMLSVCYLCLTERTSIFTYSTHTKTQLPWKCNVKGKALWEFQRMGLRINISWIFLHCISFSSVTYEHCSHSDTEVFPCKHPPMSLDS